MLRGSLAASLGSVALAYAIAFAPGVRAETLPLPKIDYEAKADLMQGGKLFIRHANGKMRIELQMPQFKDPAVGFIDLNRKVMVMMLPIPGAQDTAMEIEFGSDALFGHVLGEGQRTGETSVAGERCTIWKISSGGEDNRAAACLTPDNIALRTEVAIDGNTRTVFEVTELKRQPQNPADLEAPANLNIIKLPKGIKGIPGFPRL